METVRDSEESTKTLWTLISEENPKTYRPSFDSEDLSQTVWTLWMYITMASISLKHQENQSISFHGSIITLLRSMLSVSACVNQVNNLCGVCVQEEFYGRELIYADRDLVEQGADQILRDADVTDVGFLVVGDPFG